MLNDLSTAELTRFVSAVAGEDDESAERRLLEVYADLRAAARAMLRRERPDHTLQPTALVHEAFLRLARQRGRWKSRAHFCAVASIVMRRILVEHARRRAAGKRDGKRAAALGPALAWCEERCIDLIALNDALNRLALLDPRQSRIVELRFFGGLSVDETAEVLGIAPRTIHRDWNTVRAWLRGQIVSGD